MSIDQGSRIYALVRMASFTSPRLGSRVRIPSSAPRESQLTGGARRVDETGTDQGTRLHQSPGAELSRGAWPIGKAAPRAECAVRTTRPDVQDPPCSVTRMTDPSTGRAQDGEGWRVRDRCPGVPRGDAHGE